nr:unknown [Picea sitchensis]
MLNCCGFSTLRLQNSMVWSMESHRTIQAKDLQQRRRLRAVAEDTELVSEGTQEEQQVTAVVSQSDKLTMFFKADGTIVEPLVIKVSQALEALEDVSDVKVETLEGITTVELVKQTTVQATGVASGLVEMLLGMDFKLQSLCLSFEDE